MLSENIVISSQKSLKFKFQKSNIRLNNNRMFLINIMKNKYVLQKHKII